MTKPHAESTIVERRSHMRYAVESNVRYNLFKAKQITRSGIGRTYDISSGGLLLETDHPLPTGCNIELFVEWPGLRSHGRIEVRIIGQVVRTCGTEAAVQSFRYQFPTGHDFRNGWTCNEGALPVDANRRDL